MRQLGFLFRFHLSRLFRQGKEPAFYRLCWENKKEALNMKIPFLILQLNLGSFYKLLRLHHNRLYFPESIPFLRFFDLSKDFWDRNLKSHNFVSPFLNLVQLQDRRLKVLYLKYLIPIFYVLLWLPIF